MTVTESAPDRTAAAARWQAARQPVAAATGDTDLRRDQRVEKTEDADSARPRRQDRAEADQRARPSPTAKLFDVVA